MKPPPRWRLAESLRDVAPLLGLGVQFAVLVLIGVGAGWWVDKRYGLSPWGVLIGGIVGIAIGFYHFIRAVLATVDHKKNHREDIT